MAQERISAAHEARRLLDDPAFNRAFISVENDIVNALCKITMDGSESCRALVLDKVREMQANRRLRLKLQEFVSAGRIEEKRLETVAERSFNDPRWSE